MTKEHPYRYDIFFSYATTPDYRLVRKLESFLESFHDLSAPEGVELRPLSTCVDGSDFRTPRRTAPSSSNAVKDLIDSHLAECAEILVFCSANAIESDYVRHEVSWFLEHRGAGAIRLAVTEGKDPVGNPDDVFSSQILDAGLHERVWYDFRAFRKREARTWAKVRDFDDNRTRLAADLLGQSAGDIQPIWYREQQQAARRRTRIAVAVASAMLVLLLVALGTAVFALHMRDVADEQRRVAEVRLAEGRIQQGSALILADRWTDGFSALEESRRLLEKLEMSTLPVALKMTEAELRSVVPYSFLELPGISGISVCGDGTLLAVATDTRIRVIDLHLDRQVASFPSGGESIDAFQMSPDGTRLVTAIGTGIRLLDATSGVEIAATKIRAKAVRALRFLPRGGSLLMAGTDGRVLLWGLTDGQVTELASRDAAVTALDFSAGGSLLAVAWADGATEIHRLTGRGCELVREVGAGDVMSLALVPHGKWLATGDGQFLRIWDTETGDLLREANLRTEHVQFVGKMVFSAVLGGDITAFDIDTGHIMGTFRNPPGVFISQIAFSLHRLLLFSLCEDRVRCWQMSFGDMPGSGMSGLLPEGALLNSVALTPDGLLVASGDSEGFVRIWDGHDARMLLEIAAHEGPVEGVAFLPGGESVASVGGDGKVVLWDLAAGNPRVECSVRPCEPTSLAVSPDGSKLAVGGKTGAVHLLSGSTGETSAAPQQVGSLVTDLAFLDGGSLLIATEAGTLHVWSESDSSTRKVVETGIPGPIRVSPRNRTEALVVGGRPEIWDICTGSRIRGYGPKSATFVTAVFVGRDLLYVGGVDEARILRVDTAEEVANLRLFSSFLLEGAATPTGSTFVAGGIGDIQVFRGANAVRRAELRRSLSRWDPSSITDRDHRDRAETLAEWYHLHDLNVIARRYVEHPEFTRRSLSPLVLGRIWRANEDRERAKKYFAEAVERGEATRIYADLVTR